MGHNISNSVLIAVVRLSLVEKNGSRPVGHESPVFHGAHGLDLINMGRPSGMGRSTYKFVNGEQISLRKRILDLKDL